MSLSEDDSPFATARRASNAEEFREALAKLKEQSGLTYQQLADRSDHELPRSTAHAMCTQASMPKQEAQVRALVRVCGGSQEDEIAWTVEWRRVIRKLRVEAPTVRTRMVRA